MSDKKHIASNVQLTAQKEVRAAFWEAHPNASRERVKGFDMYVCDTRCAFADFVDMLARKGEISAELAARVTL